MALSQKEATTLWGDTTSMKIRNALDDVIQDNGFADNDSIRFELLLEAIDFATTANPSILEAILSDIE
jgi:hypothetical protein